MVIENRNVFNKYRDTSYTHLATFNKNMNIQNQHRDTIKRFEDTKLIIRSHTSKDREYNGQKKNKKKKLGKANGGLQNTLHKELKIEQHGSP